MCLEGFKPLKKNQKSQAAGRKKRTRKKRGGVPQRYHTLTRLASNEMLELFRNTVTREIVPTAMELCRSDGVKRCLSNSLYELGLPQSKRQFTPAQLETYNEIIESCKPNIAVPWNTQSGEGQGGGRKKKTRKKRKWSLKYKKSINCNNPKGFSQKQYCKYGKKTRKTRKK